MKTIGKIHLELNPKIQNIAEEYKVTSLKLLAKKYQLNTQTLIKILRAENIHIKSKSECKRKYEANYNYFDTIDTEDKAYFLGLFYADGYNCEKRGVFSIALNPIDVDILDKFKESIQFNGPIKDKYNKTYNKNYKMIDICNKYFTEKLAKLGCFQKKSLTLKFPTNLQVPEFLIHHFIRGYIDGDGWITSNIYKKKSKCPNLKIGFISTKDFCEKANEIIEKHTSTKGVLSQRKKHRPETAIINFNGNLTSMKVINWLYNNATIFLKRKRDKAISTCKEILKHYRDLSQGVKIDNRWKKPYFYVTKMKNGKSFTVGSYSSYEEALSASKSWDLQHKPICQLIKTSALFT